LLPFVFITPPPPPSTLFPYTTLFRSWHAMPPCPGAPRLAPAPRLVRPRLRRVTARRVNAPCWELAQGKRRPSGRLPKTARSAAQDRKSTRLNSSHVKISYAVFCLKKK